MTGSLKDAVAAFRASGDGTGLQALIPYARFVGFSTVADPAGGVLTTLESRPTNIGNVIIPAVHGGVVGALLEHAAIMELLYQMRPDRLPKTINVSIDYLRPCLARHDTVAKATVVKQGKRIANVRVEAFQEDRNRLVAAAHAHFLLG